MSLLHCCKQRIFNKKTSYAIKQKGLFFSETRCISHTYHIRQRWRIVNELLHSKDSDKTRTDDENRRLCSTFAHYFVDKIVKLRDSVSDTLCTLSVSVPSDLSFPSHRGSVLDILSPVTSDEVGRVLASSPAKSSTMDIIPTSLVLRCKDVFLWNHSPLG